jgi:hypothetical protein
LAPDPVSSSGQGVGMEKRAGKKVTTKYANYQPTFLGSALPGSWGRWCRRCLRIVPLMEKVVLAHSLSKVWGTNSCAEKVWGPEKVGKWSQILF